MNGVKAFPLEARQNKTANTVTVRKIGSENASVYK